MRCAGIDGDGERSVHIGQEREEVPNKWPKNFGGFTI